MCDLFPPQIFRLVLIGKDIREQIDIDPAGESVPRLYDWYDELAEHVRGGAVDDYTRLFTFCQLPKDQATPATPWQMRFREVAFITQMPHLSILDEASAAKGSKLTEKEADALKERGRYARFWLETYAPSEFIYKLQDDMPDVILSPVQKQALAKLAEYLSQARTGEEIHHRLHELKTEIPISPKQLFEALYRIFLNRDSGPKAGWFLAGLPHDFVLARLKEAVK